jgi:hypothetical protein
LLCRNSFFCRRNISSKFCFLCRRNFLSKFCFLCVLT